MAEINFGRYSSLILRHNLDLVKRQITISGDISQRTLIKIDKQLKILENQSEDIEIMVNTGGGDIEAALGIVDRIRISPCKINTLGLSVVMSAGTIILAAGKHRCATKYTRFMYHCPAVGIPFGRVGGVEAEVKYTKELGRIMDSYLSETTHKPYSFWSTLGKHVDHNFGAEIALEYGLIDEII